MVGRNTLMRDAPQLPGFGSDDHFDFIQPVEVAVPVAIEEPAAPFRVHVVRSKKRKRTVNAQLVAGVLTVSLPSWMSRADEEHWVGKMSAGYLRKMSTDRIDLVERAATLARRFDMPHARDIRWADDMTARWGSCTIDTGYIRISNRLAAYPDWVIDYVIVHELAHLEEPGHGPEFWAIVHRYPKAERAVGFLIAKSDDGDGDDL